MNGWRNAATALLTLLYQTACITAELPASDICDEVGYAISSRAFGCSGDADQASKIYDRFMATYTCQIKGYAGDEFGKTLTLANDTALPVEAAYQCPASLRQVPCAEVSSDNFAALFAHTDAVCASLMTPNKR